MNKGAQNLAIKGNIKPIKDVKETQIQAISITPNQEATTNVDM
jgi:hypothetical protein